jgi:hypothetical protein
MNNQQLVDKAKQLVDGGMAVQEALKKVGIKQHTWSYYNYAKKRHKEVKPSVVRVPVKKESGKILVFVGVPNDIASAIKELL